MGGQVRETIQRLLTTLERKGRAGLIAAVAADPATKADDVAGELGNLLTRALVEQETGLLRAFTEVAFVVHQQRGDMRAAVASLVPNLDLGFHLAETVEEYVEVARAAARRADEVDSIGAHDVAFRMRVIAADCLFFAGQSEPPGSESREYFLEQCLSLLAADPENAGHAPLSPSWTLRLASLSAGLVGDVFTSNLLLFRSEEIVPRLRALAAITESLIPAALRDASKPETVANAALVLARLSYVFGDIARGDARIEHTLSWIDDPHMRISLMLARYEAPASDNRSLTSVGATIRREIDAVRGQQRSRIGRLFVGQAYASGEGMILIHESRDPAVTDDDFFAAAEATKARLLLDQIAGRDSPLPQGAARRVAELERQVLAFSAPNPATASSIAAQMRLVSLLPIGNVTDLEDRARREALVAEIEEVHREANAGLGAPVRVASLAEVRSALREDEALVEYIIPHHASHPALELHIVAVTQERTLRLQVALDDMGLIGPAGRVQVDGRAPIDASDLGDCVVATRSAICSGDDAEARLALAILHERLVEPLVEAGIEPERFRTWIVVPHGPLHSVPFAALAPEDGPTLIQRVQLVIAPSATIWQHLATRVVPPIRQFLGLANPTLPATLPPLHEAEKELGKIESALGALGRSVRVRADASEAFFRAHASGANVIHLATHGAFPDDGALDDHQIALARTPDHDGLLHAAEVRELDLSAARLVVLNICNGGLHRVGPGDEPYGLVAAFLSAGTQNVLGTLWPIEDVGARKFITRFYRELLEHGPAEALRRAMLKTSEDGNRLSEWAPFVLVGSGARKVRPWD